MPDADRILSLLRRAVQACRDTSGRRGRLLRLEHVNEVIIAGDMHGNVSNFKQLLARAQLAEHPTRHLVIQELIHGPHRYPAGGDKSHELVDLAVEAKCRFPHQVHYLLGNHELAQWTSQLIAKEESNLNGLFREGIGRAYGPRAGEVYTAYLTLFAVLPLALRTPNRIFLSHSLPPAPRLARFDPAILERDTHDERELKAGGLIYALLWGRDTAPATVADFLTKVDADLIISGHLGCERGFDVPNQQQLILDSLGDPACYCLFPTDHILTHAELIGLVRVL